MDRYEIRREVQRAFSKGNKDYLYKALSSEDTSALVDVLWEYMAEADSGYIAKRDLLEKKDELDDLLKKINALNDKSGQRTRCLEVLPDRRALVQLGPFKEEVMISPSVDIKQLKAGVEVLVIGGNEGRIIAAVRKPLLHEGRVTKVHKLLDDKRVIVEDGGHEFILRLANDVVCKDGDKVRYDMEAQLVLEVLENSEANVFSLSEIPEATFDDVKGLDAEKEFLKEKIIYPIVYKEKFDKYGIKPIRAALFHGPSGCGKAQPIDSLILTPNGFKKMGNVKIGDEVCTPDGKSGQVIGVFPQGKKEIYKVTFSDGSSTECCLEHLWCVKTQDDRSDNKPWRVKPLSDIVENIIAGKRNYSIPMTAPVEFNSNLLPLDPYVLGVLLGDGGLSCKSPTFSTSDDEIIYSCEKGLEGLNVEIKKSFRDYDYRIVKKGDRNSLNKNPLTKILVNLGIMGKRSWEKFIPEIYKLSSVSDRIAILQGLMDTDGYVSKNGYKISFTSTSKRLAKDVKFIAESLGCKVTIAQHYAKYVYKGVQKTGRISYRLSLSCPANIMPFRLERKKCRVVPRTKYVPTRYIRNVEFIGKKEAQCILIDHSDHLYITDNFIVTHNTYIAGAIFNEMMRLKKKDFKTQTLKDYKGFFVINGPEVLSKWAGATEETIRKIFKEARRVAEETQTPSLIFWDEIESIARKRTDSATYTPEKTVVPTLLAEIQGLESTHNVILIAATNMPMLIDPALMRPGRLGDAIIEIPRPDRQAGKEIIEKAFNRKELPAVLKTLIEGGLVEQLVAHIYDNEKPLAFAKLQDGSSKPLMRQEMVNGALFAQLGEEIIRKTCMMEIKNEEPPKTSEMLDNILLSQIGILDSGVKNGFTVDTSNYVIDVSLDG